MHAALPGGASFRAKCQVRLKSEKDPKWQSGKSDLVPVIARRLLLDFFKFATPYKETISQYIIT